MCIRDRGEIGEITVNRESLLCLIVKFLETLRNGIIFKFPKKLRIVAIFT